MQEIINITLNENHEPVVSARDLHKGLEVKSKYNDWLKRMLDYGFSEGIDFVAIAQKKVTAQGNQSEFIEHVFNVTARNSPTSKVAGCKGFGLVQGLASCA